MDKEGVYKKLYFHKASKRLIINAPEAFSKAFVNEEFDDDMDLSKKGYYEFVLVFAEQQKTLESLLRQVLPLSIKDAYFWACYPKKSGKIKSDMQRETVWSALDHIGLRAVTAISLDDTWTALRARRKNL